MTKAFGVFMTHRRMKWVAGILIVIAAGAFVLHAILAPAILRVAVGPTSSPDVRIIVAFMQALQRERASVRLKLVLTESPAASATALEERKADLAIVRSDVKIPQQSGTVAIMRREAVYFLARPGSKIGRIGELRGKVIGLIAPRRANEAVLDRVLSTYGIGMAEITLLRGTQPEIVQAMQEGKVDAVFVLAPTSADRANRLSTQHFPKQDDQSADFLPIAEALALSEQYPEFDTIDLVRGALVIDPPLPEEETTTLAVTHRMVARSSLDESLVSELTRLLFSLRLVIAAEAPAANQIEVPSRESRGAKLPIHPGTIAYVEGETKTFFDRYGDWLWFGIMALSLTGSALAALMSSFGVGAKEEEPTILLARILALTKAARGAEDAESLTKLEAETDTLRDKMLASLAGGAITTEGVTSMALLLAELHRSINARRDVLVTNVARPT